MKLGIEAGVVGHRVADAFCGRLGTGSLAWIPHTLCYPDRALLYWTKPGTLSLLLSDTHSLSASDYTAQAPSYMHSCSPAFFGTS